MALVQIDLDRPMCLERYSDYRALGHVVLRDASATLAVGIITSVDAANAYEYVSVYTLGPETGSD
eukprot:1753001-Pyramimonas_sp.AAC.2